MWWRIAIILVIGACAIAWGLMYGPAEVQRRGIDEAEALRVSLVPVLAKDRRFAGVDMSVMTYPSLTVRGEVPDLNALIDLRRIIVEPQGAHFNVHMDVKIAGEIIREEAP